MKKSILLVAVAGVLRTLGLIIVDMISTKINPKAMSYCLFDGYAYLLSSLADHSTSTALGIAGDVCLRAVWIAGILPLLVALLPLPRLSPFRELVLGFAKRGKIMQSSSHRYTVPQNFFVHFYAVAVVWTTLLLLALWSYAYRVTPLDYSTIDSELVWGSHVLPLFQSLSTQPESRIWLSVFLLLLMEVQVLRRLYETVFVFNYSPAARMHIVGFLTGLFFYTAAPLSLCSIWVPEVFKFVANEVAEFIMKGKNQMSSIEFDWWGHLYPIVVLGWWQWIGAAVFFWGWIHQRRCHVILGSLRGRVEQAEEYVIPRGDWFEIVSSPHYLAEIVIYAGMVITSGGTNVTVWLLFGFVVANLVLAAGETHGWYLRKFHNYPRGRFAIIPRVY